MARGGTRQGQPGKAYSNRSDLAVKRAGQTGLNTAAAGGKVAPPMPQTTPSAPEQMPQTVAPVTPDQIPRLDDPSGRPDEPITHGLALGPGGGVEALGTTPVDPSIATIQAAFANNPTRELRRAMMFINTQPGGF